MNPLAGKHILITRAAEQAAAVGELLAERGAHAAYLPCLAVQCLPENIRQAAAGLSGDSAVLVTSANGVSCAANALGDDFAPMLGSHTVIAVGEQTAAALEARGITPAWVAAEASQEGLVRGFAEHGLPASVCFLRAEDGRDAVQQALLSQGTAVQLVHAYRTVCPDDDASGIRRQIAEGGIDAVLLGSSRTANHYVRRIGDARLADRPTVAVISPQVAAAAEAAGLHVQAVAKQASFAAMLDALADYFADSSSKVEDEHR